MIFAKLTCVKVNGQGKPCTILPRRWRRRSMQPKNSAQSSGKGTALDKAIDTSWSSSSSLDTHLFFTITALRLISNSSSSGSFLLPPFACLLAFGSFTGASLGAFVVLLVPFFAFFLATGANASSIEGLLSRKLRPNVTKWFEIDGITKRRETESLA